VQATCWDEINDRSMIRFGSKNWVSKKKSEKFEWSGTDHWSFKMSKQMEPLLFTFGW
jgi:hypothetical protein